MKIGRSEKMKNYHTDDDGFSLIELVVAVGILAILSVVGVVAYNGLTDNARKAAVQSAAAEVLTGAVAYDVDGSKDYTAAAEEWETTSDKDDEGNPIITVSATKNGNGEICVVAEGYDHTSSKGAGCEGDTGNTGNDGDNTGGDNNNGETTPPVIEDPDALTCSHNEELPNWEGEGIYNHYAFFRVYSQNDHGFQIGTTVRAYNEMDGSLVFEKTTDGSSGAVLVEYTTALEEPNRDVFCDFRVEVEHPDGEILTSITRAEDRQLVVEDQGDIQDAAYIYKDIRDIQDVNNDPIEEELPTEYLVHLNLNYELYTEDVDQRVVLTTPFGSETRDITNTAGKFSDYPGNYFTGSVSFSTHFGSDQEQQYSDYTDLIREVGNSSDWTLPHGFIAQPSDKIFDGASDVNMYCEVDYSAPEGFVNSENVWESTYNCRMTVDIF